MTSQSLDYADPITRHPRRRRVWIVLTAALALYLSLLILETATEHTVEAHMDAITGTTRWKTTWHFGITTDIHTDVSPLETKLITTGIPWTPSWHLVHCSDRNFHGTTGVACSTAPPIYPLRPMLKQYVDASTDAELRQLVQTLQTATEAEQKAAVDAASEKVLGPSKTLPTP